MSSEARRGHLVIVCGLPGAGKTTLARRLAVAHAGVRLCPDEWLESFPGGVFNSSARAQVEALQWALACEPLAAGRLVVIKWGTWARAERDRLRVGARSLGATVELRHLTAPVEVLVERVRVRGGPDQEGPTPLDAAALAGWAAVFEVPTGGELAEYDPPLR